MRVTALFTTLLCTGMLSGCYVYSSPSPYYYGYNGSYYSSPYYGYYASNAYGSAYPQQPAAEEKEDEGYCREYSHKIMVDNSLQDAHGTACRQPDGSWKTVD